MLTVRSDAIEHLAQCDTFAFDKTGTLTLGELRVEQIATFGNLDAAQAMSLAAALEAHSEHPIGKALRAQHQGPVREVSDHLNRVGEGIQGTIDDTIWRIGKPAFALPAASLPRLQADHPTLMSSAYVVVALCDMDGNGALFALSDQMRPGVQELLATLRDRGVRHIALLSGDSQESVQQFAQNLDFDEALGDQKPSDKLTWIRRRQGDGARVAMAGDGINDAPTLAAADVSVSFAHATELAQVSSGLLVLGNDLGVIGEMRVLAEKTRRIMRQNLGWAAAYNFLAVPAAALGMIAPWGAAIGMSLSSLLVVLNALRLRARR